MQKSKTELEKMWHGRIAEIEEKGNCSNGHHNAPGDLFQTIGGKGEPWTKTQMIDYCKRQIENLKTI